MKTHPSVVIALLLPLALTVTGFGFPPPAENNTSTLALITKVIHNVTRKTAAPVTAEWEKAQKGQMLNGGDKVRTAKRSLAIVKFLDNSIVRVRELSELTMMTDRSGDALIRSVDLQKGGYGFDVKKQQNEQFRLTSPTSVASIRGTQGRFSGGQGNDTLVVTEGLVNLRNKVSGQDINVAAGEIGFSNEDGTISSRKATENELTDANTAAIGGAQNELKLELRDQQGNRKELKLKYREE